MSVALENKYLFFSEYKKMPWKNGQGTTFEIVKSPENSTLLDLNFDYRLSMAEINGENKFSLFNGFTRLLTVVRGEGITFNDDVIYQLQVKSFSGDLNVVSKPIVENEKVLDLGLIYNPNKIKASMDFVEFPCENPLLNDFDVYYVVNIKNLDTMVLKDESAFPKEGAYFLIGVSSL